jgi:hypothetical protein
MVGAIPHQIIVYEFYSLKYGHQRGGFGVKQESHKYHEKTKA